MKRKRFTEEQIIGVLKESEAGAKTDDICRRHGISTATFYTWRKKYGGMDGETLSPIGPRTMVERGQAAAGAGDRECQAQADRGGSDAGHVVDEGTAGKVSL